MCTHPIIENQFKLSVFSSFSFSLLCVCVPLLCIKYDFPWHSVLKFMNFSSKIKSNFCVDREFFLNFSCNQIVEQNKRKPGREKKGTHFHQSLICRE